ncbi:hypothetical protein [Symbioplanes lichenis]|uniref:hypothetical protein n=1 Tax=Symbioplanes lichenis TaxID=1629072 RepID=UPI002739DB49|nr:hypothetical protein [Actinoplanes lichenis]
MAEASEDRWTLPFSGLTVTRVEVDFAFGLLLGDGGHVSIAGPATLAYSPERIILDRDRAGRPAGREPPRRRPGGLARPLRAARAGSYLRS